MCLPFCLLGVPIIFWYTWLILGQKTVYLNLNLCHSISQPPYGVGTWHFKTLSVTLRSSGVLGVPNIFWSAWLILGQKIAFLILKHCHSTSQSPFGIGTWSLDRVYFSIVFFGVRKFWLCLTDFGLENYVFYLKTLFGYILAPFQSLDFIFGHIIYVFFFIYYVSEYFSS